jgi:hypothetical protein
MVRLIIKLILLNKFKEEKKMSKITEDMTIADVLKMDRELAPIFMKYGLHCLG